MEWRWSAKRDWSKEDILYCRKRKVSNKGSRIHEHLIGSLYSYKMNRGVQYESFWGECLFYYLLELDPQTIRYYEQPDGKTAMQIKNCIAVFHYGAVSFVMTSVIFS